MRSAGHEAADQTRGKTYHHGDLRNAILEAATHKAAIGGLRAVAGREVATALGVAPSAAYRHFPSHAHLLACVSQRARERLGWALRDASRAVPTTSDPIDDAVCRFTATGVAYLAFARTHTGLFDAAFATCDVAPSAPDDPSPWSALEEVLDELVRVGACNLAFRAAAPYIAWSAVHGLAGITANPERDRNVNQAQMDADVLAAIRRALGIPDPRPQRSLT